jgi:hypothetical protein
MRIIDAHIHVSSRPGFADNAKRIGHEASYEYLGRLYAEQGIVLAVAMGGGPTVGDGVARPLVAGLSDVNGAPFLPSHMGYCVGLQSRELTAENVDASLLLFEERLKDPRCLGIKMYPGYNFVYPSDPLHSGFYELAAAYDVPVVFHTGDTANPRGIVKYSHPLNIDEVAVCHPNTQFVMAHYGNPWIVDATEVSKKNPNVAVDLSALAQGVFQVDWFYDHYRGYIDHLRTWLTYLGDDGKLMFGSDFPLVNVPAYIELIARLINENAHDAVFHDNALRIFSRLGALTPLESA